MREIDFNAGATRRQVLKTLAVAGAATLLPIESVIGQAPKKGAGKIDVHQHTRQPMPGQAPGNNPWTPEKTLEQMDKYNIGLSVLSAINASRDTFYAPNTSAIGAVRNSNEYHAKLAKDHPDRFGFFANFPINNVDASLKEIEYAFDTLKADASPCGPALPTVSIRAWTCTSPSSMNSTAARLLDIFTPAVLRRVARNLILQSRLPWLSSISM